MDPTIWSGYYKKTVDERRAIIEELTELSTDVLKTGGLEERIADVMVENCIGKLSLPVGIAPYFVVNGKNFIVPMSVEEPSVIGRSARLHSKTDSIAAAASGVAKLVAKCGGFTATNTGNVMVGHIQLLDIADLQACVDTVRSRHQTTPHPRANRLLDLREPRKADRDWQFVLQVYVEAWRWCEVGRGRH